MAAFKDQKFFNVSAEVGEMVSSNDETNLENCREVSEVTMASTPESATAMVSHQFDEMYPRKDGYIIKSYSVEEM